MHCLYFHECCTPKCQTSGILKVATTFRNKVKDRLSPVHGAENMSGK